MYRIEGTNYDGTITETSDVEICTGHANESLMQIKLHFNWTTETQAVFLLFSFSFSPFRSVITVRYNLLCFSCNFLVS